MNSSFDRVKDGTNEWLTPPNLLAKLGTFDLDPCSPIVRPWDTALLHFTEEDDGLTQEWVGRVYCNPPYGNNTGTWLEKCAKHGNAIALTFARTETKMFFEQVWDKADGILFIKGRLRFHKVDGSQGDSADAPSVLIAYGASNAEFLRTCGIEGKFIRI